MDFSLTDTEEQLSLEQMQLQYDNLKLMLARIQNTFGQSLGELNDLLSQWQTHLPGEFLTLLKNKMTGLQDKIKHIVTQDIRVSQLNKESQKILSYEREKGEWEQQKTKGMEMLQTLQRRNAELEQQLIKLNEMQKSKEDHNEEINRLKSLIELGKQKLVSQTEQIEQLTSENKALHEEVHELYGTLKEKGLSKAYRLNTVTDWNENDLQTLQEELNKKRAEMQKDELKRKFEQQERMYWQAQEIIPEDAETENGKSKVEPQENEDNENEDEHDAPNAYRSQTVVQHHEENEENETQGETKESTDNNNNNGNDENNQNNHILRSQTGIMFWTEKDLQAVKNEMMGELKKIKNQQIAEMVEKQDALRGMGRMQGYGQELEEFIPVPDVTDKPRASNLFNGNEITLGGDQMNQLRGEMIAEMHRLHLQAMQEMFEREEKLRWNTENERAANLVTPDGMSGLRSHDLEKIQQEMLAELREISKKEINSMFEKQFQLRLQQTPTDDAPAENSTASKGPHHSNLIRTQTTWAEEDLEKLRQEMLEDLNKKQRDALSAIIEKQEKNRWADYGDNTQKDTNGANDASSNASKEKIDASTTEEYKQMKLDLEDKVAQLTQQLNDERIRKNSLQERFEGLVDNYEKRLTEVTKVRNNLQDEVARLFESKMALVRTTAWQLDSLRRVINAMSQIESCKEITKMLLDDSLRYGNK